MSRPLPLRTAPIPRASHRPTGWRHTAVAFAVLASVLIGCERRSQSPEVIPPTPPQEQEEVVDPAVETQTHSIWLQGIGILDAAQGEAKELEQAIEALFATPNEEQLEEARRAWRRAHNAYMEFELFSALSGSNPGLFGNLAEHDFAVEAWPIQPGYLDYFDVYPQSGIVNDVAMPLTAEALRQQHGFTDASDVSLGFHAIEYLLWGEDGQRPASDFAQASLDDAQKTAGLRAVDLPSNRRRAFLRLVTSLLIDDLENFKQAFENPNGLLRRSYLTLQPYSRVTLLRTAGLVLVSHHRDLLQAELDEQLPAEKAEQDAELPGEALAALRHSPFAGGTAAQLSHSLQTVETILFQSDPGIGEWVVEDEEERTTALEQLSGLRSELQSMEKTWPPSKEKGEQMLATLSQIADLLGRDLFTADDAVVAEPDL